MNLKLQLSAIAVWFVLAVLAIVNGTVREFAYKDIVGEYAAHVISTIILMLAILGTTYLFLRIVRIVKFEYNNLGLLIIGIVWLVMTILFEFGFGHYVMGNSWERLFADYDIFEGRVWIMIPLTTLFAPLLMGRLVKR